MLSDVVAERIITLRKAVGLTREDLAERCQRLGSDLTVDALANIETGRRGSPGKRRRRKVDIDELACIALVLGVPLVWLLADPASTAPTTVFGHTKANPWRALGWATGAWPLDDPPPGPSWSNAAGHLIRLHSLYESIEHYDLMQAFYDPLRYPEPPVPLSEEEAKRNGLSAILDRLDGFRFGGMPIPPVPDHISDGISELLLDRARERLQELQELRGVADEWIPADGAEQERRDHAADTADAKALRRLSESLRWLHNFGQPLPAIPDEVLTRAKELDVNLTPWAETPELDDET